MPIPFLHRYAINSCNIFKALSDYDGKNPGQVEPKVEPLLTIDPSHPGKLGRKGSQINPAKHDDDTPDNATIKVALGDLEHLKKQHLPT